MVERAKASVTFHAMTSLAMADRLGAGRLALFEVSSSTLGFLSCDAQKIFRLAAREDSPPPASAGAASWYDQPGGSGSGDLRSSSCCWSFWYILEPIFRAEGQVLRAARGLPEEV